MYVVPVLHGFVSLKTTQLTTINRFPVFILFRLKAFYFILYYLLNFVDEYEVILICMIVCENR